MRYFDIKYNVETPDTVSEDMFTDLLIGFIESQGWTCGGGTKEVDENGEDVPRESNSRVEEEFKLEPDHCPDCLCATPKEELDMFGGYCETCFESHENEQ